VDNIKIIIRGLVMRKHRDFHIREILTGAFLSVRPPTNWECDKTLHTVQKEPGMASIVA